MTDIKKTPIPQRLKNVSSDHPYVAGAIDIIDDVTGDNQQEINADTYRKSETYSKEQLNNMITTPEQKYENYTAEDGDTFSDLGLPAEGEADTTYRVGSWDGTEYNASKFSEYSWDGTQYILLSVQSPGIDSEPTKESTKLVESGGVIAHEARMLSSLFTKPTVNDSSYINIENGQYQQPSGLHTKATRSYTPIPDGCDVMALGYTGQYQTALALYSDEGSEYLVHLEEQSSYAYYTASELEEMGAKYCRMTITDEQAENGEWFLVVANLQEYFNSRINSSIKVVYAPDLKASANSVTIDTLYLLDRGGTRTVLYADGDSTSHTPITFTFRDQAYVLVADKDGVIKTRINTTRVEADDVVLLVFSTNGKMLGGTLYPQWINALNGFVESNDILDSDLIPGGGIKKSNGERNANASYLRTDYIKIEQGMNVSVLGAETSVITPLALYSAPSPKAFVYAEQENATVSMSFDEMDALGAKYFRCSFSTSQISSGNWYLKFLNNRIVNTKIDNIEGTSTVAGSIEVVVPRRVADSLGNELTPTSIPTDGNGWETPTKKEILYIQKKAQQMLDIVWTPKSDVPHGNNDSVFEGGVPVTGLPYSSTKEIDKYIGFDVSIYTFMTAVNNPYSLLYTENIKASASKSSWGRTYHGVNNCAPYFGTVCSVLTGYATGQVIQWSSGEDKWCAEKNLNMIKVYKQDSQGLMIGDIYWKQGHNRLITGLKRDENGDVVIVHLVESYGAKVRETEKTASNFDATMLEENGIIYRNIELYKNSYTPSEFVAVDGEIITPFAYNNDICTFAGDKASFREGELVVINYNLGDTPSHEWTGIEVYKDDVLVETYILSEIDQDEVPDGQKNHALIFEEGFEYGMYKARLTDGSNYSDYTYWEVIETNVSYESSGEIQKMEYSSSNGTPLSFTVCDEGGTIYAHNELSIENVEDGYVQIDLMKLFKSQYPSRTFSPDTYLKIHFEGKYGRVTNEPLSIDVI